MSQPSKPPSHASATRPTPAAAASPFSGAWRQALGSGAAATLGTATLAWAGGAQPWAVLAAAGLCAGGLGALAWQLRVAPRTGQEQPVRQTGNESARWRPAFEHSADALLLCSADFTVRAANQRTLALLGLGSDALRGRRLPVPTAKPGRVDEGLNTEIKRADGQRLQVSLQRLPGSRPDEDAVWKLVNLSAERQAAQQLDKLANYDSLTGLPNRALFRDRLQQAMMRAKRSTKPMALMFLDLDRFKLVNDSLGHATGDALLRHVSATLSSCLRDTDTVGHWAEEHTTLSRLGGDEFTVVLEALTDTDDAAMIARRMLDALAVPFSHGEEKIVVSASIGISMYPTDEADLDQLLRQADMAMYRAKSLGRNTFCFFSDELNTEAQARLSLEGALRRAVEQQEFALHFQPKICLQTGKLIGVEALLRWNCPGKGMVPPDRFIPVLEDTGLILPVGAWVIRQALAELEHWDQQGLPPITMAVNLSARQLRQQFLTAMVEDNLRQREIPPARLELELTESLLMEDTEVTRGMLASLDQLGVRLAIDDFGTGHSSLSYLRRFRVDTLKIDRSFVSETPGDAEASAVASAIVALGRSLDMKLVAEGVETREQADFLRGLGCHEVQGYLISRPLPLRDLVTWYRQYEQQNRNRRTPLHPPRPEGDDENALLDLNQAVAPTAVITATTANVRAAATTIAG